MQHFGETFELPVFGHKPTDNSWTNDEVSCACLKLYSEQAFHRADCQVKGAELYNVTYTACFMLLSTLPSLLCLTGQLWPFILVFLYFQIQNRQFYFDSNLYVKWSQESLMHSDICILAVCWCSFYFQNNTWHPLCELWIFELWGCFKQNSKFFSENTRHFLRQASFSIHSHLDSVSLYYNWQLWICNLMNKNVIAS